MIPLPRHRPFPPTDLDVAASLMAFLDFVHTTAVNKVAGLSESQARSNPIPTSPLMSPLGVIKHLTAVLRQHVQIHIGGLEVPPLWDSADHDFEWRLGIDDTIATVVTRFDEECGLTRTTLTGLDLETPIVSHGKPNRTGRLLVDVLQECARHLGHLDIVRELIDGTTGE
ncbi:MAG: DinB family protein [Acidimicrobiia bacterium]|nr:DinB family protein [Acidimicrobiia bacterium]MDH5503538.1 DinB family protein [Acidimicrobiia bacterium]